MTRANIIPFPIRKSAPPPPAPQPEPLRPAALYPPPPIVPIDCVAYVPFAVNW